MDQTKLRPLILVIECNSGYLATFEREPDDLTDLGKWVLNRMRDIYDYCVPRDISPCIHIKPVPATDSEVNVLQVEEFLFDCFRNK